MIIFRLKNLRGLIILKRNKTKSDYNKVNASNKVKKLEWFTGKYNFPFHYFKKSIYIDKPIRKELSFYENLETYQLIEVIAKAIQEIRKCKTKNDIIFVKNKYKGLEDLSPTYKKVTVDRYEILF